MRRIVRYLTFSLGLALVTKLQGIDLDKIIPLENLPLGQFQAEFQRERQGPLHRLFDSIESEEHGLYEKALLGRYLFIYEEGVNLKRYCQLRPRAEYHSEWDELQAQRATLASLQYLGLELVINALAVYAQELSVHREDYLQLIEGLVESFCSPNMTVISKRHLRERLMHSYDAVKKGEEVFTLPSWQDKSFFPPSLSEVLVNEAKAREKEFAQTLRLFKSFCSWGNDPENVRLLLPLIRNPQVMSLVIQQMNSQSIFWDQVQERIILKPSEETARISCRGLICRRNPVARDFTRNFPRTRGSVSIADDLRRLYCHQFFARDFSYDEENEHLKKMIDRWSFDEQSMMVGQFLALVSGIPNFLLWVNEASDGPLVMRKSLDQYWEDWADREMERLSDYLYLEESLHLELIDREFYFDRFFKNFSVEFRLVMGEYDRVHAQRGKLSTHFNLKVSGSLLKWLRTVYMTADPEHWRGVQLLELADTRFRAAIEDQITETKQLFRFSPWRGDLSRLVMDEIKEQLIRTPYRAMQGLPDTLIDIPIHFHYSPFALKYIRELRDIEKR